MSRYSDADIIIVDGRNTLFRAAYSNRALGYQGPDGWEPTGGVHGFLESVLAVAHRAKDAMIVIAWEGSKKNRRELVPEYKVRKPDPKAEELVKLVMQQEGTLRRILKRTAWDSVRSPKWEADDAIGSVARAAYKQGDRVAILSTDADMLQLLREDPDGERWVRQVKPTKGVNITWDVDKVLEEWGVPPELVVDVKALSGDSSDCYKGCPGIGEKWAQRIVSEHGTVPEVLEVAESTGKVCNSEKKAEALLEHRDYVLACYEVARINTRAPCKYTEGQPNRDRLERSLTQLRFHIVRSPHNIRRMLS